MTDEQAGNVQDAPVQETPTETPSVQTTPEGQQVTTETPGTPNSADTAVSKTPEQLAQDVAYQQTQKQEQMKRADDAVAELQALQAEKNMFATKPTAQPETSQQRTQPQHTQQENEELADRLRDDPIELARMQSQNFEAMLDSKLDAYASRVAEREIVTREAQNATKILSNFCTNNSIPHDEMTKEYDSLAALVGHDVSPAAMSELIIKNLQMKMMQGNIANASTEAAAKASLAVKQAALTTQPSPSGDIEPGEKTGEQTIADKFGPSKGKSALDGMFG